MLGWQIVVGRPADNPIISESFSDPDLYWHRRDKFLWLIISNGMGRLEITHNNIEWGCDALYLYNN